MAFDKIDPKADFPAKEREILKLWEETQAFEKLRRQNAGKKKWSFLDGPITANNPMGVHHAWGRTYKDVFHRYHAAKGHDTRYQNGFDCQGLWIEVEVERQHGFSNKKDIEAFGIGKFVEECKARAKHYAAIQSEQSKRLGYWMDWDNSYYTMSDTNNYGIWAFLKKCHQQGYIYKGKDVMPWCPRCGTGISQMEMSEGYRDTEHLSVFIRLPIIDRDSEALLVWTTTPWTLTSNVAAAVKPDMKYLKVRCGEWTYYVGKGNFEAERSQPAESADKSSSSLMSIKAIFNNQGGFEVLEELDGKALLDLRYTGPFDHLPGANEAIAAHKVIAWEQVTESEGSGIVHIAPGCGAEDYQLSKKLNLPAVAPLNEDGSFKEDFGALTGRSFGEVGNDIAADLKERGLLVAKERYLHRYPHCWRCKAELVFRLVDEWFINMEWRDRIMAVTRTARWIPEWGLEREIDWLRNMGDWMISKKRYWGLALPIWECDQCGHFDIIGSKEELKERAVAGWDEFEGNSPHRPWLDAVKVQCAKCKHQPVSRVKDVGNPWLDASIVPFSTMGYFDDREHWEQWFPPDFVVEALPGQFRNWFYAMLAVSTMMVDQTPFRTLLGHGLVLDDKKQEMHKSKGNAIEFNEAAETVGVDVMRWMYCSHSPERNLAFGPVHTDAVRKEIILPLWNTYAFLSNYARLDKFDPTQSPLPLDRRTDLDRWILSDLQQLIEVAEHSYANYEPHVFCSRAGRFISELSTWYVRRSRRRFWKSEWSDDKLAAYQTLYEVITTLGSLIAPITPFLSEMIYQNLVVGQVSKSAESVHHLPFPTPDPAKIDRDLSEMVARSLRVVSMTRAARVAAKLKVRQPLASLRVQPADEVERRAVQRFEDHILEELNVKSLVIEDNLSQMCTINLRGDMKRLGPKYGKNAAAINQALKGSDAKTVADSVESGSTVTLQVAEESITLEPNEVIVERSFGDRWAAGVDGDTIVLLDKEITHDLKLEGIARDIVRQVQNLRKQAELNLEDRIVLSLQSDAELIREAIDTQGDYIARETLATSIVTTPLGGSPQSAEVKIDGNKLIIQLELAS